jgi:hypothetical protein
MGDREDASAGWQRSPCATCVAYLAISEVSDRLRHFRPGDHADAMLRAANGDELWNLAWAINSNVRRANGKYLYKFAIHSPQYTKAVHDGLEKIVKEGVAKGWDKVRIRVAIQKQLLRWRETLEEGGHFGY